MKSNTVLLVFFLLFCMLIWKGPSARSGAGPVSPYVISVEKIKSAAPYKMTIDSPVLRNSKAGSYVAEWIEKVKADFIADGAAAGMAATENTLEISLAGHKEFGPYLNLKFSVEEYMGGAHPEVTMQTFFLDMRTGKLITIENLLYGNKRNLGIISKYVINILEERRGYALTPLEKQGLAPYFNNYRYFAFTRSGLCFYFPVYQTGARGEGEQSVIIEYRLVSKFMRPDIGSFVTIVY